MSVHYCHYVTTPDEPDSLIFNICTINGDILFDRVVIVDCYDLNVLYELVAWC